MCKALLLLSILVNTSLGLKRFDPNSAAIESEAIRKNRLYDDLDTTSPPLGDVLDKDEAGEPPVQQQEEVGGTPTEKNDINTPGDAETHPFLPGSREDDPLASLQSSGRLDREIEKPISHKSSIKYAGVNHSDTYVTNNFYNENQGGIDMIVKYMWMRIYDLHDQIEALPIGIKKNPLSNDKEQVKKKALVITMDEKPTLTVDTKN